MAILVRQHRRAPRRPPYS